APDAMGEREGPTRRRPAPSADGQGGGKNRGRADASAGPSGDVKELAAGICSGLGGTRVQAGSRQLMGPSSRRRVGVDSGIRRVEGRRTVLLPRLPLWPTTGRLP